MRKTIRAISALAAALTVAVPFARAEDGATFRMIVQEPRFMDPNRVDDGGITIQAQLFEPLAKIGKGGELIYLQAKSIDRSSDGLTWTVKLRSDNKWSNGEPVTAKDWEYSLKRILDPQTASGNAQFLIEVKGAADYNSGNTKDDSIVRIRAIDEFTLVIETERVAPSFLAKLALPYITPVPEAIVKQWGERWTRPENIVSNGPYKLVSRVNDQSIEMQVNPYYSGKKPTISAIKMTVASGDICEAQLRAYEADEIDFATCIPIQDIPRVRKDPVLSTQLIANAESGTWWVQYDNSHAPWNNKDVRQALGLAVDRAALSSVVSDGTAAVAKTIVPPGIPGSDENDAIKGDVETARDLLAKAGYPNGVGFPPFTITVRDSDSQPIVAQLLQQMWQENLGISASINVMELKAFAAWVNARKNAPYDVLTALWVSDYADPENWYGDLITDDYRNSHFQNEEFAALIKKAKAATDETQRIAAYQKANKILEEQQPMSALYRESTLWLVKPYISNLRPDTTLSLYPIRDAEFLK
ncbi:peptide ABC transporter substrate-binding protein [Sinorhizobium meliloti]|uniref:peptide ABC transporter substrate-binding protein n=1 Tax=Rhizobium meliloti TaxID=382 RepID=UPI000D1F203C|nr:peptide ABC transporter substrate-binding protein [Sinorhizobium meliloti]QND29777.1 peptide ABC transporter substrate-binding protein [Sinorhizobium meliloti]RMI16597.1 peptide ABC transporter substrate-binding protein [Sinorhizobium meliloti]RVM26424.1 peptide ABC transporter substrate-binding protein [Sinorhizobium meliloti]WQP10290.1 peptide ABC transporter substrate-binding protein [Sinorhizobium meliloti]WQP23749.1 peptide ABC transporter substrate-binding protein [Sinorhizobium melil